MHDKVQTAFRLHLKTIQRLDALVKSPPAWLDACAVGPIQNRTDVVERLVFLAEKHSTFGLPADDRQHEETTDRKPTDRKQRVKKSAK